jgi:hypothetical protein
MLRHVFDAGGTKRQIPHDLRVRAAGIHIGPVLGGEFAE